ncbi:MAG: hypothetical protein ACK4V6_10495 [Microthrixaceae bacterium]
MKRRRNRQLHRQRVALGVTGAIVLAVGVAGLFVAFDVVEQLTTWAVADQPVLNEELTDATAGTPTVVAAAATAVGVLLVLLGLLWLRTQLLPRRRHEDVRLDDDTDGAAGINIVAGGALASALEDDLERHPDVLSATAEMRPDDELVRLRLVTAEQASADTLLTDVIGPAIERAVRVAQLEATPRVEVDLRLEERGRVVA